MSEEMNEIQVENNEVEATGDVDLDLIKKRFNWGAFFFTWIWGIGNKVWTPLLIIPIWFIFTTFLALGQILNFLNGTNLFVCSIISNLILLSIQIWFGIKGNLWAWQKRKYKSVEHFHKVQKIWAIVAVAILTIHLIIEGVSRFLDFNGGAQGVRDKAMLKKHVITVSQATRMLEENKIKCGLTSEKLAKCFTEVLNINSIDVNKLKLVDLVVYEFKGDGRCKTENACYVLIDVNADGKTVKLPLYVSPQGFVEVRQADVDKFFVE